MLKESQREAQPLRYLAGSLRGTQSLYHNYFPLPLIREGFTLKGTKGEGYLEILNKILNSKQYQMTKISRNKNFLNFKIRIYLGFSA